MSQVTALRKKQPDGQDAFATHVAKGLWSTPKAVSSEWFYDDRGSELFAKITELPSYYLTRTECAILRANAWKLSGLVGSNPADIVELGCGCGEKNFILLDQLAADNRIVRYCPVDISSAAMDEMDTSVIGRYGNRIPMQGIVGDYIDGLAHLHQGISQATRKIILFLGSNIGNMGREEATQFLLKIHAYMKPQDYLVVGFDLKKDLKLVHGAYDDPEGVTREFNLNLLDRMNRELGGTFDRNAFVHHPFYDPVEEGMVSWLVSTKEQHVSLMQVGRGPINFREGEGIRTEVSRKYSFDDIITLAGRSRFRIEETFMDSKNWFADVVLRAT